MEKRFCNQQLTLCKFLEVDFPETFWPNSFSSACWCQRGLVAGACRSALGPSCIPDAATKHSRTHSPNGGCKRPGVGLKLMLQTVQFSDDCCTATVNQIPRQTSSQNPFDKAYMHIYIYTASFNGSYSGSNLRYSRPKELMLSDVATMRPPD